MGKYEIPVLVKRALPLRSFRYLLGLTVIHIKIKRSYFHDRQYSGPSIMMLLEAGKTPYCNDEGVRNFYDPYCKSSHQGYAGQKNWNDAYTLAK